MRDLDAQRRRGDWADGLFVRRRSWLRQPPVRGGVGESITSRIGYGIKLISFGGNSEVDQQNSPNETTNSSGVSSLVPGDAMGCRNSDESERGGTGNGGDGTRSRSQSRAFEGGRREETPERPPQSFVFLYDHKFKGHKSIGPPGQYTLVFTTWRVTNLARKISLHPGWHWSGLVLKILGNSFTPIY
jgi:hypothetical protein